MIKQLIVLDRDGVLNVDTGYTHKLEDMQIPPGVTSSLKKLQSFGFQFAIATGQSGIGRRMYSVNDMEVCNRALLKHLAQADIAIAALVYCPHAPDENCICRKPKQGLLDQIENKIGLIDWAAAYGIGDKPSDSRMMLGRGARACLLENGPHNNSTGKRYWDYDDRDIQDILFNPRHHTCTDFAEAADWIIREFQETSV